MNWLSGRFYYKTDVKGEETRLSATPGHSWGYSSSSIKHPGLTAQSALVWDGVRVHLTTKTEARSASVIKDS